MSTLNQIKKRDQILDDVSQEIESALTRYGDFKSPHEGYAILKEEVDELWDYIKSDQGDTFLARDEAIQVAAMAVKYAMSYGAKDEMS